MAVGHVNAPHYMQDITVLVDLPIFPYPWIYPPLLGEAWEALHRRCPIIPTRQREHTVPQFSMYNFHIPPPDEASASATHLEAVHL